MSFHPYMLTLMSLMDYIPLVLHVNTKGGSSYTLSTFVKFYHNTNTIFNPKQEALMIKSLNYSPGYITLKSLLHAKAKYG